MVTESKASFSINGEEISRLEAINLSKEVEKEYNKEDITNRLQDKGYDTDKISDELITKIAEQYEDNISESDSWAYSADNAINFFSDKIKEACDKAEYQGKDEEYDDKEIIMGIIEGRYNNPPKAINQDENGYKIGDVSISRADAQEINRIIDSEYHKEDIINKLEKREYEVDFIPDELIDEIVKEYEDNLSESDEWVYSADNAISQFKNELDAEVAIKNRNAPAELKDKMSEQTENAFNKVTEGIEKQIKQKQHELNRTLQQGRNGSAR